MNMVADDEDKVLTIKPAAEVFAVSEATLRRCDKAWKPLAKRHRMNERRLYARRQVLELGSQVFSGIESAS